MSRAMLVVGVLLLATARCPVGCPRNEPRRVVWGPWEPVPTHRVGPCMWAFDEPRSEPFPDSEVGAYGVQINGFANWIKLISVDLDAGTITLLEPECSRSARSLEVVYARRYLRGPP